ncbi:potassium channel family protein [Salegentibacter sp. JZCK2]|uniref:ion channel n=1 Tax=Salegentibacter tibetensis TaxID=2873600 RepID=UPI001CD01890|nr:ion channel [Salegentibacter tibetensis]MBZ9728740.1 potassium channel family protein [Salegentibacter tibetensis]
MSYLLILLGIAILIVALIDIFKNILYINGGGDLSSFMAGKIWWVYFQLARGNAKSPVLNLAGGTILMALVLMWIGLIWLGYSLIYLSDPNSVLESTTGASADIIGNIYYVGYTLTSLGNGDLKAGTDVWRIVSNIMGVNSMIFISLGISYILPVLQAVVDKRTLAVYIYQLGRSPKEIINKGYNGEDFTPLYSRFQNLETMLLKHGEHHLAYPILHYFHTNRRSHSIRLNLAILDEALNIQEAYRLDKSANAFTWRVLRGSMDNLSVRLQEGYTSPSDETPDFNYFNDLPDKLKENFEEDPGIPDDDNFNKRRGRLLGYIKKAGWDWEDVIEPK